LDADHEDSVTRATGRKVSFGQGDRQVSRKQLAKPPARDPKDLSGHALARRRTADEKAGKRVVAGASNLEINHRMILEISHVPTGFSVTFPAFLELFSDAYTSEWNAEQVYGRMDPIATFAHTRRALSIAWNVPAESMEHAKRNIAKVNRLLSFLYPTYEKGGGTAVINQSPMLKIRFGNLIQDAVTGGPLLGYVNGFTFDPMLEYGMFAENQDASQFKTANHQPSEGQLYTAHYYPKTFRLNCEFNVLHQHSLGFAVNQAAAGNGKYKRTYTFNDKRLHRKSDTPGSGRRETPDKGDFERGGPNSTYPYHTHAGRKKQTTSETVNLPQGLAPNDPRRLLGFKALVYDPSKGFNEEIKASDGTDE
jgi:hypothetical protein